MIPLLLGSSLVLLATFIVRRFRRAGFVASNPHYQELLNRLNLHEIEDFLALPAVIISGHPDRHVARLTLGQGTEAQPAFLKREHRVRWRDRLASWWAGFGWSSKSSREALILQKLQQAGVPCANWIAFGEDHRGRAFLLLAGLSETIDLPQFLRDRREGFASPRRRFAAQLGVVLAQLHEAGFEHRDLYAKHVLVSSRTGEIFFLDWQRSRHSSPLRLNRRWHDLAALDATLAEDLVTPAERLLCLYSYLRTTDFNSRLPPRHLLSQAMTSICRASHRLLSKRHVRNERLCTHSLGSQGILWLDGEALCVTEDFWDEVEGQLPVWLRPGRTQPSKEQFELANGRQALLVREQRAEPLRWLWASLRRHPLVSQEVRRAGALVSLRRRGLPVPRLLAFGEQHSKPWRTESFLVTELAVPTRRVA